MTTALSRIGSVLGRLLHGPDRVELVVGAEGPRGDVLVPREGDGVWEVRTVQGRPCLSPDEKSHYLYFVLPAEFLARAGGGVWLDVEYFGDRYAPFRVQYASRDTAADVSGLY
jgi:hypothetical protein